MLSSSARNVGDTAYDDFSRKKQLIEAGEAARMLAALPQIGRPR
jgi:hypothetical protein